MKALLSAIASISLLGAISTGSLHAVVKGNIENEVQQLLPKIQAKAQADKEEEADYADELNELDVIIAAHKTEQTDDAAGLLILKAQIYFQLLKNPEKAKGLLNQVKTAYPGTDSSKKVDDLLAGMDKEAAANKIRSNLRLGSLFPEFAEMDLDGKPLSIAACKGKVVLVDFWATWCGPCVSELPNVLKAFEKYHGKGFEIIGISLDSDKDKLVRFIEENKMGWQQFFDGQGWQNKLASQYSVNSIPTTYLLDKEGRIIAKGLRGMALEEAVAKALGM